VPNYIVLYFLHKYQLVIHLLKIFSNRSETRKRQKSDSATDGSWAGRGFYEPAAGS